MPRQAACPWRACCGRHDPPQERTTTTSSQPPPPKQRGHCARPDLDDDSSRDGHESDHSSGLNLHRSPSFPCSQYQVPWQYDRRAPLPRPPWPIHLVYLLCITTIPRPLVHHNQARSTPTCHHRDERASVTLRIRTYTRTAAY